MIDNFLNVFSQVLVLFGLTSIGFICGKINIINENSERDFSAITLYISTPCVILYAFQQNNSPRLARGFISTFFIAAGIYAISILLAHATLKNKDEGRRSVLRFATVFSNSGFMGLPLAQSIYGDEGVLYSATIIALFNFLIWTYGYFLMGSGKQALPIKKLLLNPGILALLLSLLLFSLSIELPAPINHAVKHAGNLNTPLGMFIIGSRLSRQSLKKSFQLGDAWLCTIERLLIIPTISVFLLYLLNIRGIAAIVCLISGCAPAASSTTMFAVLFRQGEKETVSLSASIVSVQTILSAITMPIIICIAQSLLF